NSVRPDTWPGSYASVSDRVSRQSTERMLGATLASRYVVESVLGDGAMGTVFRARHAKIGRPFAVKVLHKKLTANEKLVRRFDREAEIAGRLHHTNVVAVIDQGVTDDGFHYLVMDYAPGMCLANMLD